MVAAPIMAAIFTILREPLSIQSVIGSCAPSSARVSIRSVSKEPAATVIFSVPVTFSSTILVSCAGPTSGRWWCTLLRAAARDDGLPRSDTVREQRPAGIRLNHLGVGADGE